VKFKDAPGLILDLRSNGGGDGETGLQIASYFFNDKNPFGRIITRTASRLQHFSDYSNCRKNFKQVKRASSFILILSSS
jgi:C-terminal processing protease CtpA/Prc